MRVEYRKGDYAAGSDTTVFVCRGYDDNREIIEEVVHVNRDDGEEDIKTISGDDVVRIEIVEHPLYGGDDGMVEIIPREENE
jgi:hypothetical protein